MKTLSGVSHNLLVVDWDYFFPNPYDGGDYQTDQVLLYDWNHIESPFFVETLWGGRADGFLMHDLPLPRCSGYEHFWERFGIEPGTPLWVADSNALAGLMEPNPYASWSSVWLFDAHHDCGYKGTLEEFRASTRVSCEDWMIMHHDRGARLHVRYPTWKIHAFTCEPKPLVPVDRKIDPGFALGVDFDGVFLCRSGAWVPPWCDDQLTEFIDAYPAGEVKNIDANYPDLVREFSEAEARLRAQGINAMMNGKLDEFLKESRSS